MRGLLLIISGPSGAGKSTVIEEMLSSGLIEIECRFSVSMTTRPPRPGEVDGVNYRFVTTAEFEKSIEQGSFLEYARYNNNYYGTPAGPVMDCIGTGCCAVLDIEVQGMLQAREKYPQAVTVYIKPPSWDELERRLRERGTENEERIKRRLEIGRSDAELICEYRHVIVNDDVKSAARQLAAIIREEYEHA